MKPEEYCSRYLAPHGPATISLQQGAARRRATARSGRPPRHSMERGAAGRRLGDGKKRAAAETERLRAQMEEAARASFNALFDSDV